MFPMFALNNVTYRGPAHIEASGDVFMGYSTRCQIADDDYVSVDQLRSVMFLPGVIGTRITRSSFVRAVCIILSVRAEKSASNALHVIALMQNAFSFIEWSVNNKPSHTVCQIGVETNCELTVCLNFKATADDMVCSTDPCPTFSFRALTGRFINMGPKTSNCGIGQIREWFKLTGRHLASFKGWVQTLAGDSRLGSSCMIPHFSGVPPK